MEEPKVWPDSGPPTDSTAVPAANSTVSSSTTILSQEITKAVQTGTRCIACGMVNITYGAMAPLVCANCGSSSLKKEWQHLLTSIDTIEAI